MLPEADDYYWTMAGRRRLIVVDGGRTALCTFFLLRVQEDIPRFYDRRCWSTPPDFSDGTLVYIDKLWARHFTRSLFRELEMLLTDWFPQVEQAVWYRPGQDRDRRYAYRRRHVVCREDIWRKPTP